MSGEGSWKGIRQVYGGEGCEARVGVVPNTVSTGNGPLLKQLQASGLELSVNQYYAGGYLHANDIATLATSEESLQLAASGTGESFF